MPGVFDSVGVTKCHENDARGMGMVILENKTAVLIATGHESHHMRPYHTNMLQNPSRILKINSVELG